MEKAIDMLTIGDVVIDAFIRLKDASVHCRLDNEDCEICMKWGDKIPYEFAEVVPAVGNSANAAVSAARLGLNAALRAYVGDDQYGKDCIDSLTKDGVDVSYIEKSQGKHTNYHYVLWYEGQRTILVKHETFEYHAPKISEPPKWLYLSSLGDNTLMYHHELMDLLDSWKTTKLAFQPGTFQMKMGLEALKGVYERTHIFFCNKEEAERILTLPSGSDMKTLLKTMQATGPKIVVITDDARGAYAIEENGTMWHVPRYPDPRPPYEITGAGDAFASTTVSALILGKPLHEAMLWGATNSSSVLQGIGAQKGLLTREQLEKNLANPPAAFAVEELH